MSPRHFRWARGQESEINAQSTRAESAAEGPSKMTKATPGLTASLRPRALGFTTGKFKARKF